MINHLILLSEEQNLHVTDGKLISGHRKLAIESLGSVQCLSAASQWSQTALELLATQCPVVMARWDKQQKKWRTFSLTPKARYVNPQLSPAVTEKLKQKVVGQTRLRQINGDEAHYDISGYVSDYSVTTTGITNQNASTNRLNVSFHLTFKNTLDQKKDFEADITNNYDFSAQLSLQQAEVQLWNDIVKNLVDGI